MIKVLLQRTADSLRRRLMIRRKPEIIQLPITSRCNSACKTCNIWKLHTNIDISPEDLKKALAQPFFSEVISIGINGGEPSLHRDIEGILNAFSVLKKLRWISVISNGVIPQKTLRLLENCREVCRKYGWKINFTVSLDGVADVDDVIRGVRGHFDHVLSLLRTLKENPGKYCDQVNIGCTISKYNVCHLPEIDTVFKNLAVPVEYHLAVPNKRIHTFDDADYSVLNSKRDTALAAEFFLWKYSETRSVSQKLRYWSNYYYLLHQGHRRVTECTWLLRDVTIDEELNMYLCATASEKIGSLLERSASEIIKSEICRDTAKQIKRECCRRCVHYSYQLTLAGMWAFLFFYIKHSKWNLVYSKRAFPRWLLSR